MLGSLNSKLSNQLNTIQRFDQDVSKISMPCNMKSKTTQGKKEEQEEEKQDKENTPFLYTLNFLNNWVGATTNGLTIQHSKANGLIILGTKFKKLHIEPPVNINPWKKKKLSSQITRVVPRQSWE